VSELKLAFAKCMKVWNEKPTPFIRVANVGQITENIDQAPDKTEQIKTGPILCRGNIASSAISPRDHSHAQLYVQWNYER
jgi:hypothetical protein